MSEPNGDDRRVGLREAAGVWARVAALSFGGPAGQIAVMHRILVEEKRWIGDARFLHALHYCMLLPGPEAQQLSVYLGWLMHGTAGGFLAGCLFILPGFVAILALSVVYVTYGDVAAVDGLFFGLKAAVLAVVLEALGRISKRSLVSRAAKALAGAAFLALFVFGVPFPFVILAAAAIGFVASRQGWSSLGASASAHGAAGRGVPDAETLLGEGTPAHARPSLAWSLRIGGALLAAWLVPVAAIVLVFGATSTMVDIALFFSKMAVVTFGGAYAVLSYVAQQAVGVYGWLEPTEMLDGLGMAETTPGPLIMVTQFVGFLAAYRNPGPLSPMAAGMLGAVVTVWVTFVPCFLWIFLGAPFIETLRGSRALAGALAAIAASVVGVIANLAVWFAMHVLFAEVASVRFELAPALTATLSVPVPDSVDLPSVVLFAASAIGLLRMGLGAATVLAASSAIGVATAIW